MIFSLILVALIVVGCMIILGLHGISCNEKIVQLKKENESLRHINHSLKIMLNSKY